MRPSLLFCRCGASESGPAVPETLGGATYYFQSGANKAAFDKEPSTYALQYGGYCAMAMTMGKLEDIDPTIFWFMTGSCFSNETRGRT